jgi:hypothetical protein
MPPIKQLAIFLVLAACSASSTNTSSDPGSTGPDAGATVPCVPPSGSTAPTYTALYTKYFALDTPGHCAKSGCHSASDTNDWQCGADKDTCYRGMVKMRLIDTANPTASRIGDTLRSPLIWVNPNGIMPDDAKKAFPEGRDAILAWVAACAQNN